LGQGVGKSRFIKSESEFEFGLQSESESESDEMAGSEKLWCHSDPGPPYAHVYDVLVHLLVAPVLYCAATIDVCASVVGARVSRQSWP
jgi:hypothetical protein